MMIWFGMEIDQSALLIWIYIIFTVYMLCWFVAAILITENELKTVDTNDLENIKEEQK